MQFLTNTNLQQMLNNRRISFGLAHSLRVVCEWRNRQQYQKIFKLFARGVLNVSDSEKTTQID